MCTQYNVSTLKTDAIAMCEQFIPENKIATFFDDLKSR